MNKYGQREIPCIPVALNCSGKLAQDLLFPSNDDVAWRWDGDVGASEGKTASPLAGSLLFGHAEGAV